MLEIFFFLINRCSADTLIIIMALLEVKKVQRYLFMTRVRFFLACIYLAIAAAAIY